MQSYTLLDCGIAVLIRLKTELLGGGCVYDFV